MAYVLAFEGLTHAGYKNDATGKATISVTMGETRAHFDAFLQGKMAPEEVFNEETWGASPEAVQSQASLMAMVGGMTPGTKRREGSRRPVRSDGGQGTLKSV